MSHQSTSSTHIPHTGGQQGKASSPVFPTLCAQGHGDELGAESSLPKHENKGRQRCLSGLITAARDTCTLAFPLHELYRLLPHSRNEFHLLSAFQRLMFLGNCMKNLTMLLFTLTGAKLASLKQNPRESLAVTPRPLPMLLSLLSKL